MITVEILCDICGDKVGTAEMPDNTPFDEVVQVTTGYVCEKCHEM